MTENTEELELLLQGKLMKRIRNLMFSSLRDTYDLKQIEIEIIIFLNACSEQSAAEMARKLFLKKGHVSMALDRLRDKNLIVCTKDSADRRAVLISLSEKGRILYRDIIAARRKMNDIMLNGFSEEETELLCEFSGRIVKNVFDELNRRNSCGHEREGH